MSYSPLIISMSAFTAVTQRRSQKGERNPLSRFSCGRRQNRTLTWCIWGAGHLVVEARNALHGAERDEGLARSAVTWGVTLQAVS